MSYSFTSISLGSLSNARYSQFCHYRMTELDKSKISADFGVPAETVADMQNMEERLADLVNSFRGSGQTAAMVDFDSDRDGKFRALWWIIKAAGTSSGESTRQAYNKVSPLLTTYPLSMCAEDYAAETAHMRGFLLDLRKFPEEVLSGIGITAESLTALEESNNKFQEAFLARNEERSTAVLNEIKKLRFEIEESWSMMAPYLLIASNQKVTEENAAKVASAQSLIDRINEVINYFNVYYIWKTAKEEPKSDTGDTDDTDDTAGTETGTGTGTGTGAGAGAGTGTNSGTTNTPPTTTQP